MSASAVVERSLNACASTTWPRRTAGGPACPAAAGVVKAAVASEVFADCAGRLIDAWRSGLLGVTGGDRLGASRCDRSAASEAGRTVVSAVWTGPKTPSGTGASTERVLLGGSSQALSNG
jgi:hypothetical protein